MVICNGDYSDGGDSYNSDDGSVMVIELVNVIMMIVCIIMIMIRRTTPRSI